MLGAAAFTVSRERMQVCIQIMRMMLIMFRCSIGRFLQWSSHLKGWWYLLAHMLLLGCELHRPNWCATLHIYVQVHIFRLLTFSKTFLKADYFRQITLCCILSYDDMLYLTDDLPRYPEQGCSLQVYNLVTHHIKCHEIWAKWYILTCHWWYMTYYVAMIYLGLSLYRDHDMLDDQHVSCMNNSLS